MKGHLNVRGVLAFNIFGSIEKDNVLTHSILKTLEVHFDNVDAYPLFDPRQENACGNISIFCYDGEAFQLHPHTFMTVPSHAWVRKTLLQFPQWKYKGSPSNAAHILTDNFNPIENSDISLREEIRLNIIQNTPWDILNG